MFAVVFLPVASHAATLLNTSLTSSPLRFLISHISHFPLSFQRCCARFDCRLIPRSYSANMLSNKVLVAFAVLATIALVKGFSPATPSPHRLASSTSLQMGLFDSLSEAFSNEEYSAPPEGIKASARHILVKEPYQVELVMDKLKAGEGFANVAREMSTCPSGSSGGSLGSFGPGTMIQAFDEVIFDKETPLGEVVGPVQKQFGYHLIVVDKRTGV